MLSFKYSFFFVFLFLQIQISLAQCVTSNLYMTTCGSFTPQTFTTQSGANNGTAPAPNCNGGSAFATTGTWVHFTYVGPPTQQYLEGGQAAGGAGNNPAIGVYTNNGCTLLGCSASNANPGPTEGANDGKIDLTTLGLTVGQEYLVCIYNEGNTNNNKDKTLRCIPPAPCGDCYSNPCVVNNINTTFSSSTFGSHFNDCCTFPLNNLGAVSQLNCAGPGQVSVDGNVWYQFTVCQNGIVTANINYSACSDALGSQIWFLQGNCTGGTANFTILNNQCANNGTMDPVSLSYNCVAGQTYYILVDSFGGNVCNFTLSMTGPVCVTACTAPLMTSGTTGSICSNTGLNFGLTANIAGTTFSWVATDNPNVSGESLTAQSGSTLNNTLVNNTTTPQTVTYTVTPTSAGCVGTPQTITITVNPTPLTPTITTTSATCLANGTATMSNYVGTQSYNFTPSGPSVGAGGIISSMTPGTSYTVTTSTGTCTSTASASFSISVQLTQPSTPTITTAAATCLANGTATITNYIGTLI
ncbi:MAG: putative adhesin, partial [Bacteroidota bacterium]